MSQWLKFGKSVGKTDGSLEIAISQLLQSLGGISCLKKEENVESGWDCQMGLSVDCPRLTQEIHRSEGDTKDVSGRNYKSKLQAKTSEYDSKTVRLTMNKYWTILREE